MSSSTKKHFYPHILRTSALVAIGSCQDIIVFYLIPPENALTIEQMFMHLKGTFDASVAIANRTVVEIGVGSTFGAYGTFPADYKKVTLNTVADPVTRKVDIKLNISSLLNKANAGYRDNLGLISIGTPTYIYLRLNSALSNTSSLFTIDLWKVDALYTIKKIP